MFPAEHVGTVVSFGQVAGALGGAIFQPIAGHILQFTHSFVPLFMYSASAYLIALVILRTLAPGLKRADLAEQLNLQTRQEIRAYSRGLTVTIVMMRK